MEQTYPMSLLTITTEHLAQLKEELIDAFRTLLQLHSDKPRNEFVRSKTAKEILMCSDSKLETLIRNRKLPVTKILGTNYFRKDDLDNLFTQNQTDKDE